MRDWLNCRSPPPSTTNLALDETKQPPACPSRWWTIASPSVSRSCRAMQRAAAGKADRAVGSVDGPTLLLAEVRSDLGKFDKWPVLCLPVRIVDGGEMSSHRGLEIEVSAPRTGPESRIRRHRSIVPFMWWYHFHFPISCAISCLCHIFPPGIDECVILVQVVHPVLLLLCPTSVVSGRPPPHYRDAMSPENVKHERKRK